MNVRFDPVLKILSGKVDDSRFCECFDRHRGLFFSGKDRYFPYESNGFIFLDHVHISIFKFVDDAVFSFGDDAEMFQLKIFLMDDRARRIHPDGTAVTELRGACFSDSCSVPVLLLINLPVSYRSLFLMIRCFSESVLLKVYHNFF